MDSLFFNLQTLCQLVGQVRCWTTRTGHHRPVLLLLRLNPVPPAASLSTLAPTWTASAKPSVRFDWISFPSRSPSPIQKRSAPTTPSKWLELPTTCPPFAETTPASTVLLYSLIGLVCLPFFESKNIFFIGLMQCIWHPRHRLPTSFCYSVSGLWQSLVRGTLKSVCCLATAATISVRFLVPFIFFLLCNWDGVVHFCNHSTDRLPAVLHRKVRHHKQLQLERHER